LTTLEKITQAQAQLMYESVRETVKLNGNEINNAAPENFTVFVNISDILPPSEENTPFIPSTTTSTTATSTSTTATTTSTSATSTLPPAVTTSRSANTTTTTKLTTSSSSTSFESTEFQKLGKIFFFLGDTLKHKNHNIGKNSFSHK